MTDEVVTKDDLGKLEKRFDNLLKMTRESQKVNTIKCYGDEILNEMVIKTDINSKIMYLYDENLHYYDSEFADEKVKERITELLDDKYSDSRIKQTTNYIKIKTGEDLRKYGHRNCICLNNGIFDLDACELIEPDKNQFISFRLDVDFVNPIDMEPWNNYINGLIHQNDILKLQECIGNIFTNHYITKKVVYLYGKPDSGKSTFIKIIQNYLGKNNYSTLSLMDIEREGYHIANLYNKHANLNSETDFKMDYKNVTAIKKLTGGDEFTARMIYREPFSFTNTAKIFLGGNGIPYISKVNEDDAFFDRWEFIPFYQHFTKDDTIVDRYSTPEMKSMIFNWGIEGYTRLKKNNWVFSNAYTRSDAIKLFETSKTTKDSFYTWLMERSEVFIDIAIGTPVEDLFRDCRVWHVERGLNSYPINITQFGIAMKGQKLIPIEDYYPMVNQKQKHEYRGIRLKK